MLLHEGPNPVAFGNVPVFSSITRNISFSASGGVPHTDQVVWNWSITGPNAADFSPTTNTGTTTQSEPDSIPLTFTPSAPGARSATMTITGDMINGPIVVPLSGTGAPGGSLTLTPQTTNDFGPVQDGTPSTPLNVLAENNSGTDIIVTAIAFNGDFSAGPGQPTLPFTLLASGISPPVPIPVIFTPSVTGFHITAKAVEVTSNATNNPTDQAMQGTGYIITPVFSLPLQPQAVLMAFVNAAGAVQILRMDSTDLDCEEQGFFKRIYDWGSPLFEKYLGRVILRYEDEFVAGFGLAVLARIPRAPNAVITNVTGGGLNDGLIHNAFGDLQVSGDLIEVEVNRAGSSGPIAITEIFHEVDKRGEVVEAT